MQSRQGEGDRAAAGFFSGKTIHISVHVERGVAYDLYPRLVARHMGRHLPGRAECVVENRPQPGSKLAARIYRDVVPDGTTLAGLPPGLYLRQITGNGGDGFDWARLTWIGSPAKSHYLLYMRSDAPYATVKHLRESAAAAVCGAGEEMTTGYYLPKLLEATLGIKFHIVSGFKRGQDIDLAVERGALQCRALTIDGFFSHEPYPTWLRTGFIRVLLQTGAKRDRRLPDVPTLHELMDEHGTKDSGRDIARLLLASSEFGRPIVGPPAIPHDRVEILRDAFAKAMRDPALVAEAARENLEINPAAGRELEILAREVVAQPRRVVEAIKSLLEK